MFIPSNRLRRVDTPDAPTPGVVPPVIPPVAPPGYTAAPAAPAAGPAVPGAPKKPMSKGLLIGLIAGGAALVVVAIIAVVALVLPSLLGGGTDTVEVADINGEPDTTWKFDWVGDNDADFVSTTPGVTDAGTDLALVWPEFDYDAYSETAGDADWYEGYDEQYADGYDAGVQYLADYNAYWDDYSGDVAYPEQEDYFPEGAYDDYDEWRGFQDGFYDGYYEEDEGASALVKPVDPDFTPTLTLLNTANGDEVWTVDLSEVIDGADYQSTIQAYNIAGSDAVLVQAAVQDEDSYTYTTVTLDKSNGKVLSTLESDGAVSAEGFGGDVILAVTDEDGEETTVGRYSVNAIDDDPKWDASVDGSAYIRVEGDFIAVSAEDAKDSTVLDANSGEEAEWGDDLDDDVYYTFLDNQLLRFETDDKGYEVEGYNTNGDSTWDDTVKAENVYPYGDALFTYEADGDAYSELQRINPSNGSEMWEDAYGDEFDYVIGVQGSSLLLASGTKVVVVDLNNGEEKFTQKAGDLYDVFLGANQYYAYVGDELAAYSYGDKGDVWKIDVDDNESIAVIGKHLVLIDTDKGTLNGLGS